MGERVRGDAAGLAAGVVAALIGHDDAKARRSERFDLLVPGIPKFRETVEEKNDGSVPRASGDGMEFDGAVVKTQVFQREWHRCRVYARNRRLGNGSKLRAGNSLNHSVARKIRSCARVGDVEEGVR
jgi:hypothetical protein